MAHVFGSVISKQVQRLSVGDMTLTIGNSVFQWLGVSPIAQHYFIVIRFQKSSMALLKIMRYPVTGNANIGNHSNMDALITYHKTMRICGIVFFAKRGNHDLIFG